MRADRARAGGARQGAVRPRRIDPQAAATLALYHDASEVLTGDLPTPVKYKNAEIKKAYKTIEYLASEQLYHMLPDDLRPAYSPYLLPDRIPMNGSW